jgi:ADP-ribosylglycohydrolase
MTLFTAEGLIRAWQRGRAKGIWHPPTMVHRAYLRWLHTQGVPWEQCGGRSGSPPDGWLISDRRLHQQRAPGNTCLSALRSGRAGTTNAPVNDSKGCGGVMRAAPVGLMANDPKAAFELGCDVAALTHGHPSGWLPAGVLAAAVALLRHGAGLLDAIDTARSMLEGRPGSDETSTALGTAVALASEGMPSPEQLEHLGGAWVGEEALAIAVCCALAAPDARTALLASVNHSGDSDSTGALCGNLIGAAHGTSVLPDEWVASLDVGDLVEQVADDLWRARFDPPQDEHGDATDDWWTRYPGW